MAGDIQAVLAAIQGIRSDHERGHAQLRGDLSRIEFKVDGHGHKLADHGERLARLETNDERDAEDRERRFFVPPSANGAASHASSAHLVTPACSAHDTHNHRESWKPGRALVKALLSPKVLPWMMTVVGLLVGGAVRHCVPSVGALLPSMPPDVSEHHP